jgi:hypothetical protein
LTISIEHPLQKPPDARWPRGTATANNGPLRWIDLFQFEPFEQTYLQDYMRKIGHVLDHCHRIFRLLVLAHATGA